MTVPIYTHFHSFMVMTHCFSTNGIKIALNSHINPPYENNYTLLPSLQIQATRTFTAKYPGIPDV